MKIHMNSLTMKNNADSDSLVLLLEEYFADYYAPLQWEFGKKAKNYIAILKKGKKEPFIRKYLKYTFLDDYPVFNRKDFQEGDIIELKSYYIKSNRTEIVFHGLYIITIKENGIWGEPLSQKEALEFFTCKELALENLHKKGNFRKNIEKKLYALIDEYGKELVLDVFLKLIEKEVLPPPSS